jgi:hypothetical protein
MAKLKTSTKISVVWTQKEKKESYF